jgi:hypothetical protein
MSGSIRDEYTFAGLEQQITSAASGMNGHESNTSNPHSVTQAQVGLGNVDNTSDAEKPISDAAQTALDGLDARINQLENLGHFVGSFDTRAAVPQHISGFPNGITVNDFITIRADADHGGLITRNIASVIDRATGSIIWAYDVTLSQDLTGKADKVGNPVSGNFAGLDGEGNLTNNGKKPADFTLAADFLEQVRLLTGYGTSREVFCDGAVTVSAAGYVKWTPYLRLTGLSNAAYNAGLLALTVPAAGTVVAGLGTASSITATADGILLPAWSALIFRHTPGSAYNAGTFYITQYHKPTVELLPNDIMLFCVDGTPESGCYFGRNFLPAGNTYQKGFPAALPVKKFAAATAYPENWTAWGTNQGLFWRRSGNHVVLEGWLKCATACSLAENGAILFSVPDDFKLTKGGTELYQIAANSCAMARYNGAKGGFYTFCYYNYNNHIIHLAPTSGSISFAVGDGLFVRFEMLDTKY